MSDGICTNTELLDTIIVDLNRLPKVMIDGQFIQFCTIVGNMGQKLINLRNGIDADIQSKNNTIETLKQALRDAGQEVTDMSPAEFFDKYGKKDGAENGDN